jgi:predicted amidohydrolase
VEVPVAVAQTPVTWDIRQNLAAIAAGLAGTQPGEVVVLPEACLSGRDGVPVGVRLVGRTSDSPPGLS